MPSKFHKTVVAGLLELGEDLTRPSKRWKTRFTEVFDGNKTPIKIFNPITRRLMGWNYYPDAYYVTKVERKFIFEVIDRESTNEIVADYIQAVLSHAHAIIFVTKPDRAGEVKDIIETLNDILKEDLRIKKRPYRAVFAIDPNEFRDLRSVKRELNRYLERYWYTRRPIKQ